MADEGGEPQFLKTISHDLHAVEKLVKELREGGRHALRFCYEAGPTGFVLARRFKAWSIECLVISPTHIPKGSGDKIKTDRRDAIKLAKLLRSGDLKGIHIPDEADEAVRDLCRARTACFWHQSLLSRRRARSPGGTVVRWTALFGEYFLNFRWRQAKKMKCPGINPTLGSMHALIVF